MTERVPTMESKEQKIFEPSLLEKAGRIAIRAHEGQKRKESNLPYIHHPYMAALELKGYGFDDVVVAAVLVHDVPEDTKVTIGEIRSQLGDEVADIVEAVTNDSSLSWEDMKLNYIEKVRAGSEKVKAVATIDKVHNLKSLLIAYGEQGEDVWKHFNAGMEKKLWFERAMLVMLKETWNHPLVDEYESLLKVLEEVIPK